MIKAIICVLFSILSLTGCAKTETVFKKDGSVIIAHYKEDTITTVTFTDSYPVGDYSIKVISTLDFSKITNLSEFGIKSPYPSLKEFTDFLLKSGWNTVDK